MKGGALKPDRLYRHLRKLRWVLPVVVLALAALHQLILGLLLERLPASWAGAAQLAVYGVTGIVVGWIGLTWILQALGRQLRVEAELRTAYADLERAHGELRAIHELGRRITNATEEQELLELAARMPLDLVGGVGTAVASFDAGSGRIELEMTWGLPERAVAALRRRVEEGLPAQRCASCRPLAANLTDRCPLLEPLQEAGCADGVERVVCLPLTRGRERLGVVVTYLRGGPPPAERLHLLNILATEITAALEGVRLRERQMATLYAVERATQERQDLDALLERALETTVAGWGAAAGAILLVEGAEGAWSVRARRGFEDEPGKLGVGLALKLAEECRTANRAIVASTRDARDGFRSVAAAPLQAEGETVGALVLAATRPGVFVPAHAGLLAAVAHQIALAVRTAELYGRLREMAVLEERYRLSREMHDGLAQTLGYMGLETDRLQRLLERGEAQAVSQGLAALRRTITDAYLEVREATEGLRLPVDGPETLAAALEEYVEDLGRRTGLAVECSIGELPASLSAEAAVQLLRIAQEALTNVRRHANARRVRVLLQEDGGCVELLISDDGQGFDPSLPPGRRHLGLATMRERARGMGARFTLATSPGKGSTVSVRVPVSTEWTATRQG